MGRSEGGVWGGGGSEVVSPPMQQNAIGECGGVRVGSGEWGGCGGREGVKLSVHQCNRML